jgi:hypothetical protein
MSENEGANEGGAEEEDKVSSERYRVLPIRSSLFPPVKEIFLAPLAARGANATAGAAGAAGTGTSAEGASSLALLGLAPQLKIYLRGVHSTLRPEVYDLVRSEVTRFCQTSGSRSWGPEVQTETETETSSRSFMARERQTQSPLAAVQEITLELLYAEDTDSASTSMNSSLNTTTEVDADERKHRLLRLNAKEGYWLRVTQSSAHIRAYSAAGLQHGLGSFSQLVMAPRLLPLPLEVLDWPSNPWRGEIGRIYCSVVHSCCCLNRNVILSLVIMYVLQAYLWTLPATSCLYPASAAQ